MRTQYDSGINCCLVVVGTTISILFLTVVCLFAVWVTKMYDTDIEITDTPEKVYMPPTFYIPTMTPFFCISHVVVSGDTLEGIVRNYQSEYPGLTVEYLAEINGLADPNYLPVGLTLNFCD